MHLPVSNIKQPLLASLMLFTTTMLSAGAQPLFTFEPTTPTTIRLAPYDPPASIQYRITNQMAVPQNLTLANIPGITQITTGTGSCSNPFYLQPHQSCLLNLTTNGAQLPIIQSPQVCKADENNTPNPFLCARSSQANSLDIQERIQPYAYLSDDGPLDRIDRCEISSTGSLINCVASGAPVTNPKGLVINPNQTRLYMASASQADTSIKQCDINRQTGRLSNCTNSNANLLNGPRGITMNPAGTILYVTNQNTDDILQCPVNTTTGKLDRNCTVASYGTIYNNPEAIAISPDNLFAYIINRSLPGELIQCNVISSGSLTQCTVVQTLADHNLTGLSLNTHGSMLYIAASSTTDVPSIDQCTVVNGSVGTCTQSPTFSGVIGTIPRGIAINESGNIVYVLSSEPVGTPYAQCSVGTDGLVTTCANPASTPTDNYGIALLE